MARFRFTVNEKRSMGAARAQQQEQQQQGEQQQQQVHSESDNNTDLNRPMIPPVLALPAFQPRNWSGNGVTRPATCEDNIDELQEHIHRDLEEIRRELDSVEVELRVARLSWLDAGYVLTNQFCLTVFFLQPKAISVMRSTGRRYDIKEEERSCQISVILPCALVGKHGNLSLFGVVLVRVCASSVLA
ncbi:unnamed protein product [Dovyalis caffra]|uniref:Uncharacterized protein n=1 Tax=Dovyalis caffra TaxID=77055 RepID=A0AAV1S6Q2_9ROSI|nr:unnamed protein product [Dovyalis caffra]